MTTVFLVFFEVKDGDDNFRVIDRAERVPQFHTGWESVNYKGLRYQLHGGVRNPLFINIKHPIKGRG